MSNAFQASHKASGALSKLIASGQQYAGMSLTTNRSKELMITEKLS